MRRARRRCSPRGGLPIEERDPFTDPDEPLTGAVQVAGSRACRSAWPDPLRRAPRGAGRARTTTTPEPPGSTRTPSAPPHHDHKAYYPGAHTIHMRWTADHRTTSAAARRADWSATRPPPSPNASTSPPRHPQRHEHRRDQRPRPVLHPATGQPTGTPSSIGAQAWERAARDAVEHRPTRPDRTDDHAGWRRMTGGPEGPPARPTVGS